MNPFSVRGCHKGGKYTPYSYEDNRSWKECSQVSKQNSLAMERSNRIMPVTPCCIITEGELLTFPLRYQAGRVPACCLVADSSGIGELSPITHRARLRGRSPPF